MRYAQNYSAKMTGDAILVGLGRRTRELRTERRLTLRELAERSSLSARFLVQVESGEGNISVKNLSLLARALGTSPAALLMAAESEAPSAPVIALLGLRGAGKSTIGRRLARRLRVPFLELDKKVEEAADLSLAEIFALHGEAYFRRIEKETLTRLLDGGRPMVLACGGGLVTSSDTFTLLCRRALTVWLRAEPEDHWNRVVKQGDRRPMAHHPQAMGELRRLLRAREPLYAEAAHTVQTSKLSPEEAVAAVESLVAVAARTR
jgi:XRE family transcriptional regulator, aerobic/anaerobic benzoate catabolism transcriptional regulator